MKAIVVTGTDTGIGKTVFSAALAGALGASYWKPVQAGLDGGSDSQTVERLSGAAILPERHRLRLPASPHRAAMEEGIAIDPDSLALPDGDAPLVVEGAGGLMVPLDRKTLFIDVFARWGAPLVLCARTSLGTINHTLLSLAAIRARAIPLLGVAFIGAADDCNEQTIARFSGAKRLGRLPVLSPLTRETLAHAFAAHFDIGDFR